MTKKELMQQLYISKDATLLQIMEKLFCVAILQEGVDMADKIFSKYLELREIMAREGEEDEK